MLAVALVFPFAANAADWPGGDGNWNEWSEFSGESSNSSGDVFFTSTSAGATVTFTDLFYYGHYGVYHQIKFRNGLENPVVFTADTDEHGFKSDSTSSYARLSVGNGSDGSLTIDKGYYFFQKGVNIADSDGGNANGILTMRGGTLATAENGIKIGNNSGYTGTFNYYAGTIESEIKIGATGGSTGNFNVYGDLTLTNVLQAGNANSSTSSILVDGATLTLNAGLDVGRPSSSTASVVVTNGEINITSGNLCIARANDGYGGGNATANVTIKDGGRITVAEILTGRDAGGVATFRVEEGGVAMITNSVSLAYGGGSTGTVEVAGGSLTVQKEFNFANGYAGPLARYIQTGGDASVLGEMRFCERSSNTVVTDEEVHLNGGTLTTKGFAISGNTKTDNVYSISFDGGTLKPANSYNSTFIPSDTRLTVSVKENGGTVNTDGKNLTFASPILHGGTAETDGGIVKKGEGTLTLSGANTFTGDLEIKGGSVALASGASLAGDIVLNGGSFSTASAITNNVDVKGGVLAYSSSLYTGTITLSGGKIDIDVSDYASWGGATKTITLSNVTGMTVNNVLASTGSNEVSASVETVNGNEITVKLHDAQRITVGQYVQLASTSNVWPSPEGEYHNDCNSEQNGKQIGSSHQGSWFRVDLYNPTAGDYALEFKGGVKNATTKYLVTVTNATGYARSVTVSQRDTGNWTAEDDAYLILDNLPSGDLTLYFELTYSSTTSWSGNYGYFKFTSIDNMRTLTTGAVENADVVVRRKSANNAATTALLSPNAEGKYYILDGWNIVVDYTANDGYYLDGTSSFEYTVSGNINMSGETLPVVTANPVVTVPALENATIVVKADGVVVEGNEGNYSVLHGSKVVVTIAANDGYVLTGTKKFTFDSVTADTAIASGDMPVITAIITYSTADAVVTDTISGPGAIYITAKTTLKADWSGFTGTIYVNADTFISRSFTGAANATWVVNGAVYLYEDGNDSSTTAQAISFGTLGDMSKHRFYMYNGEQDLTIEIGARNEDSTAVANSGIGGSWWYITPNDNASVTVRKVGTGKFTTNLVGARKWEINEGEVAFTALTAEEKNDYGVQYRTNCNEIAVASGATLSGWYGANGAGLAEYTVSNLTFASGATFAPDLAHTWNVKSATIDGVNLEFRDTDGLVYGNTYTIIEASEGITGTPTSAKFGDFDVSVEDGTRLVARFTGIGAWIVANGERLIYTGPVTNATETMSTVKGIVIEDGGRMIIDASSIVYPADGTFVVPNVTLPDGQDFTNCVSVVYQNDSRSLELVASNGYGWFSFDQESGETPAAQYGDTFAGKIDDVIAVAAESATMDSSVEVTLNNAASSVTLVPGVKLALANEVEAPASVSVKIGSVDATSYYTTASLAPVNGKIAPALDEAKVRPAVGEASLDGTPTLKPGNVKAGLYYGIANSDEVASGYENDAASFVQATADNQDITLESSVDLSGKTLQFFKIKVSDINPNK